MANGDSDVLLQPGQVKVQAWDLCVDAPDRRKNTTAHRRALVHDLEDGLTMNWGDDYPGGVTVRGTKKIVGKTGTHGIGQAFRALIVESNIVHFVSSLGAVVFKLKKLVLQSESDDAHVVEVGGKLRFTDEITFSGSAKVSKAMTLPTGAPVLVEYDLLEQISALRGEVQALKSQLNGQQNWRWCKKCQGMFFAGTTTKGVCPSGGEHSLDGSGNYRMLQ